jgi:hypothetical protein
MGFKQVVRDIGSCLDGNAIPFGVHSLSSLVTPRGVCWFPGQQDAHEAKEGGYLFLRGRPHGAGFRLLFAAALAGPGPPHICQKSLTWFAKK